MKTKEELNALKEEVKTLNAKLAELSEEELAQVAGGIKHPQNDNEVEAMVRQDVFRFMQSDFDAIESREDKHELQPYISAIDTQISNHAWADVKKLCMDVRAMTYRNLNTGHIDALAETLFRMLSGLGY